MCQYKSSGYPLGTVFLANVTQTEENGSIDKLKLLPYLLQTASHSQKHPATIFSTKMLKCDFVDLAKAQT